MTKADDKAIAQEILRQLGGRGFVAMTGAKHLAFGHRCLSFQLPGKPGYVKNKARGVRITLTPLDYYTVEFLGWRGHDIPHVISTHEQIGCEELAPLFERETGLYTQFPTIRRAS